MNAGRGSGPGETAPSKTYTCGRAGRPIRSAGPDAHDTEANWRSACGWRSPGVGPETYTTSGPRDFYPLRWPDGRIRRGQEAGGTEVAVSIRPGGLLGHGERPGALLANAIMFYRARA